MRMLAVMLTFVVVAVGSAWADDLYPPAWRGQPGSTFQQWEFSTPNPTPLPDLMLNPYGTPSLHAYPGTSQNWVDQWGGRQGMWPLSGTIEVTIPNSTVANPYKDIRVQADLGQTGGEQHAGGLGDGLGRACHRRPGYHPGADRLPGPERPVAPHDVPDAHLSQPQL